MWNNDTQPKRWDDSNALVLKFSYEGETFLLPSDIRHKVEKRLGEHNGVTTMTASHHGSKSENTDDLYENTTPDRVLISATTGGTGAPPDSEVFDVFNGIGVATYWTAVHGNVTFTVDDGELFVNVENPATTDPADLEDEIGNPNPLLRAPEPP